MAKRIADITKKRGRPKTTGIGDGVMVRIHPDRLALIDAWRARFDPPLTRPEAIRTLTFKALSTEKKR